MMLKQTLKKEYFLITHNIKKDEQVYPDGIYKMPIGTGHFNWQTAIIFLLAIIRSYKHHN